MKIFTTLFFCFLIISGFVKPSLSAGEIDQLQVHQDRLLLIPNEAFGETEIEMLLGERFADLKIELVYISGLEAYILKWENIEGLAAERFTEIKQALMGSDGFSWVGDFIHDQQGTQVGLLNKLFIKLKQDADLPALQENLSSVKFRSLQKESYSPNVYSLILEDKQLDARAVSESLESLDFVLYAEPDYLIFPIVNGIATDDEYFERQWHLSNEGTNIQGAGDEGADISAIEAWEITTGIPEVVVAVMDSGIDTLHEDLVNNLIPGLDLMNDDTDGFPTLNFDEDGHGTCCAGIIAAEANNEFGVSGVAPDVSIMSCRVFKYIELSGEVQPISTASYFANGIAYAAIERNAHVQSHSWSLPAFFVEQLGDFESVEDAITNAVINGRNGKGCSLFFSSGNDNEEVYWPGTVAEAISVSATSMCDERKSPTSCDGENWGGHYGPVLDLAAPGVRIPTTDASGTDGFSVNDYALSFNGTSAACPIAAATAALIYSVHPSLTHLEAKSLLLSNCDKVGGYEYDEENTYGSKSNDLGYGRVNAFAAVTAAESFPVSTQTLLSSQMKVFPNPVQEEFVVDIPEYHEGAIHVCIFDSYGRLVAEQSSEQTGALSLSFPKQANSGIYVLSVESQGRLQTQRLMYIKH